MMPEILRLLPSSLVCNPSTATGKSEYPDKHEYDALGVIESEGRKHRASQGEEEQSHTLTGFNSPAI
jgi:hypothetical protein